MKYMHLNSSCAYAGVANMLEIQGYDTEDYEIALDMYLPYYLYWNDHMKEYQSGVSLQSEYWFNLYLKPRGFQFSEHMYKKNEVLEQLNIGSMIGIMVTPEKKHAVIFEKECNGKYVFLNNKSENSQEPDKIIISKVEFMEQMPEDVMIGGIEKCIPCDVDFKTCFLQSMNTWERLENDLQLFMSRDQTSESIKKAMNSMFRPILLDGLAMMKLLQHQNQYEHILHLQQQFLSIVKKKRTAKLADEMDMILLHKVIETFQRMILEKYKEFI